MRHFRRKGSGRGLEEIITVGQIKENESKDREEEREREDMIYTVYIMIL